MSYQEKPWDAVFDIVIYADVDEVLDRIGITIEDMRDYSDVLCETAAYGVNFANWFSGWLSILQGTYRYQRSMSATKCWCRTYGTWLLGVANSVDKFPNLSQDLQLFGRELLSLCDIIESDLEVQI